MLASWQRYRLPGRADAVPHECLEGTGKQRRVRSMDLRVSAFAKLRKAFLHPFAADVFNSRLYSLHGVCRV